MVQLGSGSDRVDPCSLTPKPAKRQGNASDPNLDILTAGSSMTQDAQWSPCSRQPRMAVIVPFRNRDEHLRTFLGYMIPMLQSQQIDFKMVVVEQRGNGSYNKGRLFNAGFEFVMALDPKVDCVILHDVDLLPLGYDVPYRCSSLPVHMAAYVDTMNFKLPFVFIFSSLHVFIAAAAAETAPVGLFCSITNNVERSCMLLSVPIAVPEAFMPFCFSYDYLLGGVVAITPEHYRTINGFSNNFWDWGGEDDDLGLRVKKSELKIFRYSNRPWSRYRMLNHTKRYHTKSHNDVMLLLATSAMRMRVDGLRQHMWKIHSAERTRLYYNVTVDVGPRPSIWGQVKPFVINASAAYVARLFLLCVLAVEVLFILFIYFSNRFGTRILRLTLVLIFAGILTSILLADFCYRNCLFYDL